ncbi:MAG: hypothetical protein JOZ54_06670 [Acidobacteria bacterium]|nr:hypothetical protein [Acidobacteriota bacterium]
MSSPLVSYLSARPDAATFLLPADLKRTLEELFPRGHAMLPSPYKIFPADETQTPHLGFPVADTPALKELEARLDRWLAEEIAWHLDRTPESKERATLAFNSYISHLMKLAENALMSNLLNDYHAIFWLAHSLDLARHFSTIVRGVSKRDSNAGRTQGEALKYRIFARWAAETREQMTQLAARAATTLEGEEQRGLQFFRLLQDDVLILTEEFIGPDLRELRSFITGYLRRDFQAFRDSVERLREAAVDLLLRDRTFKASLPLFGTTPDQGITLALLLDSRFQTFLFEHPSIQNAVTREEREQFQLIARRLREFSVLHQLRRGIIWMTSTADGHIVPVDRRGGGAFSRSTRPLDFGRPGVVDPMIHRFGIIYDISAFSETLGNIRRGGRKEEIGSYRQMLLFQRKLEAIAHRHLLQFEKFLGDGAFYTTRRALRVVRAAVEIQRFYSEMRRKGFAFNKGLRIALNYGYYRLLPMKGSPDSPERITEFYGPGIVELSRLTTGKATKEIDEFAAFLVARGYEPAKVQQFFAPLARGVDMIDHLQHAREFYAYLNANGNLFNEGIVTSFPLLQELSTELANEGQTLCRLRAPFGTYIGFPPAVAGLEWIGIRLLGSVQLKGLDNVEIGEIVPFAPGEAEATSIDAGESFVSILRQELHQDRDELEIQPFPAHTTHERALDTEIVICIRPDSDDLDEVLIGEWDPRSDNVLNPLRMPRGDFLRLFSLKGDVNVALLSERRSAIGELYHRLTDMHPTESVPLADFRDHFETFLLGDIVEKLTRTP